MHTGRTEKCFLAFKKHTGSPQLLGAPILMMFCLKNESSVLKILNAVVSYSCKNRYSILVLFITRSQAVVCDQTYIDNVTCKPFAHA